MLSYFNRKSRNHCGSENLDGFLSVKLDAVVAQTTRQPDIRLLDMFRDGSQPKTCGSVHCGSWFVKKVEHQLKHVKIEKG